MAGTIYTITDANAAALTIAGASLIDLTGRTTPIVLTLAGDGTGSTTVRAGPGTAQLDASADADGLTITGGAGALFLLAGAGATTLAGQTGASYVTAGTGSLAISAGGPVALLPNTGLTTVTGNLAGLTLYGDTITNGFLPVHTLLPNVTSLTAHFIQYDATAAFSDGVSIATRTATGTGDTYFAPRGPFNTTVYDERDLANSVTLTASVAAPSDPVATAVWNPVARAYDATVTGQANGANEGVFIDVDGAQIANVVSGTDGTYVARFQSALTPGTHTVTALTFDPGSDTYLPAYKQFIAPVPHNAPRISGPDPAAPAGTLLSATGTADAGATVTLLVDGVARGTTVASAAGAWTIDITVGVPPGGHTLVASGLGNTPGETLTSGPLAQSAASHPPAITGVVRVAAAPLGTQFSLTGTADPGTVVTVTVNGTPVAATATAGTNGAWTLDVAGAPAGSDSVTAAAPDVNHPGTNLVSSSVVVQVAAPPVLTGVTAVAGGVRIDGTTAAPGPVTITLDGGAAQTVMPADGVFAAVFAVGPGSRTFVASQAEALTATPGVSDPLTITVPHAPTIDASRVAGGVITLSGTADPLAAISVHGGGAPLATNADGGGHWTLALAVPTTPTTVLAEIADPYATAGVLDSAGVALPVAPTITGPDPAAPPGTAFSVAGTAAPGASVAVASGALTTTVIADASGSWHLDVTGPLQPGPRGVIASVIDAAGDTLSTATHVARVASVAPTIGAPFKRPGAPAGTLFSIGGTADPGATLTLTVSGAATAVTVTAGGTWTADIAGVGGGTLTVGASTVDANTGASRAAATVTVAVPSAPALTSLTFAGTPPGLVVAGTAAPGAPVAIMLDGTVVATATAGGQGAFSQTLGVPMPGAHSVSASVADPYGALTFVSTARSVTVPRAPVILSASLSPGGIVAVSGTADAGAHVSVSDGAAALGSTTADALGAWHLVTAPLAAGPHAIGASVPGVTAGSALAASPVAVAVPSRAPVIETAYDNPAAPAGTVFSVRGTADPGATVTVAAGSHTTATAADATGAWSVDFSTLSGPQTVTATTPDANTGHPLAARPLAVDLPSVPVITRANVAVNADGTTDVSLFGTADPYTALGIAAGGDGFGATFADALGRFSFVRTLSPAEVAATDLTTLAVGVGNPYATDPLLFTVAPPYAAPSAAPVITGTQTVANATHEAVAITGTASPGAVVRVTVDGTLAATATADRDGGVFALLTPTPAAGSHQVVATVAGTPHSASTPYTLRIAARPALTSTDTTAAPPGIALELHGTADPGAAVTLTIDGGPATTVNANARGVWTDDIAALGDGTHAIGLSTPDANLGVTVTASASVTLSTPAIGGATATASGAVTVTGTAAPGARVTLTSGTGATEATAIAGPSGTWSAAFQETAGAHSVIAAAIDPARGTTQRSQAAGYTVTPSAPDPAAQALLAARALTAGTPLGDAFQAIASAQATTSLVLGIGAAGTVTAPPDARLIVNAATAPLTLTGPGLANQIVRNAGGPLTYLTNGGSGVFLDAASTSDDTFRTPLTGGGAYVVQLGSGRNLVDAKSGDTTVFGGGGANIVYLGTGTGTVTLAGHDTVVAGAGMASVHATGGGNELIFGGRGDLVFDNNTGVATVASSTGSTTIRADSGSGVFWGGSAGHNLLSANNDCTLVGGGNGDQLYAWGAHNELWAVHGNATIRAVGSAHHNLLIGGDGDDWLSGNGPGDTLIGGSGNSTLWGGAGDELIQLSQKQSIVYAGDGNETLIGGTGAGQFVFFTKPAAHTYEIRGFVHGQDRVDFANHAAADWSAALRSQTLSAAGVTLSLRDGTKIVFTGLDRVTTADIA